MQVAIDEQIFAIQRYGGISRMFAELARQFVLHQVADVDLLPFDAPVVNRYLLDHPEIGDPLGARPARNEWSALARYLTRPGTHPSCDIVHNSFYLPHGLAPKRGAKRVVTVHDMIPELLPHTRRRLDWLTMKRRYVERADHIICVSAATQRDLQEVYGPVRAPVTVVHHGVDERFHPGAPRLDFLPQRYVLFVGNRDQYKDAQVLFEAFASIAEEDRSIQLLCVGGAGLSPHEVDWLRGRGIRERVSQRYLSDADMASAYTHAEVFVFPSRFEGFGLPALEAMASGTPAILARATSLPEVGGDAALYFEPGDVDRLTDLLAFVLHDSTVRARLSTAGLRRARRFTWQSSAERTAEVYRAVLA
ncbi:MAG: glycosyltransferase family 4 protein [Candidatus Nanopelagicales bacterium]|nr:glycosyltransferase family 4 protein [Candidatus Nanopelagicales bacterium]MCF8536800.1 glycosyltransferase family 4 protein [Candidatus Nanopelagicales bacterium]MCF8541785.1 glycosyltransferase family 4 protein [Candidatus Nanopelagicales bacterium]MCF8556174.1 glycosyltransferase family 4 protein [Candidatus Nanopelagicales bacterium]